MNSGDKTVVWIAGLLVGACGICTWGDVQDHKLSVERMRIRAECPKLKEGAEGYGEE